MLTADFDRLRLRPGALLLDLGCGDGRHARATRLLPEINVVALDIGAKEIAATAGSLREMDDKTAVFRAARDSGSWIALRGDSYRLPFADEVFDCVIASEILEHLENDDRALAEIYRVLRPGGELVVSVPRFGPELICWALSSEYRNTPGGHVRIYRRSVLARKIASHGFELFDAHFAHALHSPYWWLKCAVGLQTTGGLVALYQRFLEWEMFAKPPLMRSIEWMLNPIIGKSEVFYACKSALIPQPVQITRRRLNTVAVERYAAACT